MFGEKTMLSVVVNINYPHMVGNSFLDGKHWSAMVIVQNEYNAGVQLCNFFPEKLCGKYNILVTPLRPKIWLV